MIKLMVVGCKSGVGGDILPVSEVSAMLVATTHFLTPSGAFWNIFACKSLGSCEYIGNMASGGASSNSPSRSVKKRKEITL